MAGDCHYCGENGHEESVCPVYWDDRAECDKCGAVLIKDGSYRVDDTARYLCDDCAPTPARILEEQREEWAELMRERRREPHLFGLCDERER